MVTRFMGLIVASMGMQFVLTGLKAFLSLYGCPSTTRFSAASSD
jgi:hypothetical protein